MLFEDLDVRGLLNGLRDAPAMDPEVALRLGTPEGTAAAHFEDLVEFGGHAIDDTGFRIPHDPVAARRYLILACGSR